MCLTGAFDQRVKSDPLKAQLSEYRTTKARRVARCNPRGGECGGGSEIIDCLVLNIKTWSIRVVILIYWTCKH